MNARVLGLLPKGQRSVKAPFLNLYPWGDGKRHYLYAIGFEGGITKIGRTRTPRLRLKTHFAQSGGAFLWCHLFQASSEQAIRVAERLACGRAAKLGERIAESEWFRGLSRADVLAVVRGTLSDVVPKVEIQMEEARLIQERLKRDNAERATAKAITKAQKAAT